MDKKLSEKEIKSLISLIDDNEVYETVFNKIVDLGDSVISFLDEEIETSLNTIKTNRLQKAYDAIVLNSCISEIRDWKNRNPGNLFKGLTIISRLRYPKPDLGFINKEINKIKDSLWLELNDNLTALEKVRVLNNVFFDMYKFAGDTKDFFNPQNSFLSDVLKRKKGNPITLSALYSIVAQSVGVPVYGVNMPRHFLVAYTDRLCVHPYENLTKKNILFYINPFARGEIYSLQEVYGFLNKLNIKISDEYILPCSNLTTVKRSVNNLILIYKNRNDEKTEAGYRKILEALEE